MRCSVAVLRKIDLVLRFLYVALVPFFLAVIAQFMSVLGLVITTGLATTIALLGTRKWHARVDRVPLAGRFLGNFARLGEYYAERPPKLLVYYILYPLLFPYWLIARQARREFLVYRRINAIVLVIAIVSSLVNYLTKWSPDIPWRDFLGASLGLVVMQLLLTFSVIMPIVTTIITYHRNAMKKSLVAVIAIGVAIGVPSTIFFHRFPFVGLETQVRIKLRTKFAHEKTKAAMHAALDIALDTLAISTDGDLAVEKMHEALEVAYRHDEAYGFLLIRSEQTFVIMAKFSRSRHPVAWLAATVERVNGKPQRDYIDDPDKLPAKLHDLLSF